jgi:Fe-S cluster assembly iron-binding protein IscA
VLTLTPDATQVVEEILSGSGVPEGSGIRIVPASPTPPTEVEAADLRVVVAAAPDPDDQVIEEAGARVFVEETVAGYVDDKLLDAQAMGDRVRFTISDQP